MTTLRAYIRDLRRKQRLYGCPWYWRCCTNRDLHRQEFYYRKVNGVGRFYCGACERLDPEVRQVRRK
jgi:predicted metal-binding protein